MASTWYRDLGIGSYGSKMRVRVDALRQSLSGNYTRVRVRIYAYNGSTYSKTYNLGSGAAVAVSGDVSHSDRQTFSIGPGAWGTLADWEFSVGHDADGEKRFSITGRLSDTGTSALGNGGSITVTGTFDPLYLAPTSPTWGSTDYQDPDRVRVSWNRRASARGAYSRIRVQRWARSTGKWYHRAVLSGSATSYTDTSLSSNNEHRWRVRAEGPGGNSSWVQGGTLGTTPAAATNVRASKAEQGIDVSWTDNAARTNRSRTFYIDDNPGGNGWERVGSIGGSATSWSHADADPAVTHQYRVWTRINSQIDLTSAASDPSNTVQLQAAPDQPWRMEPSDSLTFEVGDTLPLEWKHLPVDTTAQTEAELQWRLDGGEWTTETVTGPEEALEVTPSPAGARARFEWRVRTRGAHPDWSPWSTINGPLISTRPVIAIQAPTNGEALATSRVTASWTYEPGGDEAQLAQAEWKVSLFLWGSGTLIEQRSGTTAEQVALGTRLENGTEYVLTVAVRNGDGLWSDGESARFSTDFPVPAEVTVEPRWDRETAAVSVGFHESEELRAYYRWTGEAGASTSEKYVDDPALAVELTQMVPNGDLADEATGWDGDPDWERVTVNGPGGGTGLDRALKATATGRPYTGPAMPVISGQDYIFEVWLRADLPDSVAYIELRDPADDSLVVQEGTIESGGSGTVAAYPMTSYTVPTAWTLYRVRFTPKTGIGSAVYNTIYVNHANGTERNATVWMTGFKLYPASAADEGVVATNLAENPFGPGMEDTTWWKSARLDLAVVEDDGRSAAQTTITGAGYACLEPATGITPPEGVEVRYSVELKVGFPVTGARLLLLGVNGATVSGGDTLERAQTPEDGWVRLTTTGTITAMPADGYVRPIIYVDGHTDEVGGVAWVRDVMLTHGETDDAYFDGDTPGVTDVDAIDVERREPDGSWTLIASAIDTSSTITDRTPHIGDVEYRAISRTTLPTETEGPAATAAWVHDRDPVWVNGGDGMGQQCLARGAEATDEHAVDQALHRFAGQERPVAFFGTGQEHRTTFSGKILPHYPWPVSSRDEWVALLQERGLVCFRDCTGRKVFGVLSVSFGQSGNVQTVSLEVEEAQHEEGVPRVSDLELEARMGEEASA